MSMGRPIWRDVLEQTQKEPFPRYLKRAVLEPLGLTHSGFEATPGCAQALTIPTTMNMTKSNRRGQPMPDGRRGNWSLFSDIIKHQIAPGVLFET